MSSEYYMSMWVVYKGAADSGTIFCARQWFMNENDTQMRPTGNTVHSDSYSEIKTRMDNLGLVRIPRDPSDDPVIVESWI